MKVEIIKNCPSCNSLLRRIKDQLFCINENCSARNIKQVENFSKVLKIKGLGLKTIEKLKISTIEDIYNLDIDFVSSIIGTKLSEKLISEINKTKNINLENFLAACSIPLIGITAAKKVAKLTNDPLNITTKLCKEAGLGDKATENLVTWINNEYPFMDLPITFKEIQRNTAQVNLKVCITGKIKGYTKDSLATVLASKGVEVVSSVSNNINYLICDELKGSSKENKAKSLNIEIKTLKEFMEIINE